MYKLKLIPPMYKQHELIQSYFDAVYNSLNKEMQKLHAKDPNQIYGELYYYSTIKMLKYLSLSPEDHFLDLGSGFGKLVFQLYLSTNIASVTGIEINEDRHRIEMHALNKLKEVLPSAFISDRKLKLIQGNFLSNEIQKELQGITVIYVCSSIFSFELLEALGKTMNSMANLQKIASLRKLPHLSNFKLIKTIFLHTSWDRVACYIYTRKK